MSTPNGKHNYRTWLRTSPKWETLRMLSIGGAKMICQGCGHCDPKNHVHHIAYPPKWDETTVWHLRVLCRKCHDRVHELTKPSDCKTLHEGAGVFRRALKTLREEAGIISKADMQILGLANSAGPVGNFKELARTADALGMASFYKTEFPKKVSLTKTYQVSLNMNIAEEAKLRTRNFPALIDKLLADWIATGAPQ